MNDTAETRLRSHLEALFREELQDNLSILSAGLRELQDPVDADVTAAVIQDLFRAAHSLKGAAYSAGMPAVVRPCHQMEERLAAVRAGQSAVDEEFLTSISDQVAALAEVAAQAEVEPRAEAAAPLEDTDLTDSAPEGKPGRSMHPSTQTSPGRARVAVRALDDLVRQTAALSSATDQLRVLTEYLEILREATDGPLGAIIGDFKSLERTLGRAVGHISSTAQGLRMQPIDDVTAGMDHIVRELCRATGKRASLLLEGGDVELDRDVADAVREPLLHLVRNAVDHGIEPPEHRAAAGKPPEGTVRLSAALDGGRVCITVADDGGGLDMVSLRAAAGRARGAVHDHELAFVAGVSTAPAVTHVSGRGVGLDAVRARVESLGGSVRLSSCPGQGTEVVVHIPTSLAVLRVILVRVGGELVALPVAAVQRLRAVEPGQVQHVDGRLTFTEAAGSRPAVCLGSALGLSDREVTGRRMIAVELAGEETLLLVDSVESDRETLLQPLPPRARGNRKLLGAVLLPLDRVALVVNPWTCVRDGRLL